MTHEELRAHKGTVWSCAGLGYPAEYEYIETVLDSKYGVFKRVSDGDVVSIPTLQCHSTERGCVEREIIRLNLVVASLKLTVTQLQRRLDVIGEK